MVAIESYFLGPQGSIDIAKVTLTFQPRLGEDSLAF